MRSTPRPWSILTGEDGTALVVPAMTSIESALTEVIDQIVGERFMSDNPVIRREATTLKIQPWRSCTAQYLEAHGIDAEEYGGGGWWSSDGDGQRSIDVLYVDRSLEAIAEEAAVADRSDAERAVAWAKERWPSMISTEDDRRRHSGAIGYEAGRASLREVAMKADALAGAVQEVIDLYAREPEDHELGWEIAIHDARLARDAALKAYRAARGR